MNVENSEARKRKEEQGETEPGGLERWWRDTAHADWAGFIPKYIEYGSGDLAAIGRTLAGMIGWYDASVAELEELGCFFYLLGKVARMGEAYQRHELPSDDTLHDSTVYTMMMRKARRIDE